MNILICLFLFLTINLYHVHASDSFCDVKPSGDNRKRKQANALSGMPPLQEQKITESATLTVDLSFLPHPLILECSKKQINRLKYIQQWEKFLDPDTYEKSADSFSQEAAWCLFLTYSAVIPWYDWTEAMTKMACEIFKKGEHLYYHLIGTFLMQEYKTTEKQISLQIILLTSYNMVGVKAFRASEDNGIPVPFEYLPEDWVAEIKKEAKTEKRFFTLQRFQDTALNFLEQYQMQRFQDTALNFLEQYQSMQSEIDENKKDAKDETSSVETL
jgi:hypothetical protein